MSKLHKSSVIIIFEFKLILVQISLVCPYYHLLDINVPIVLGGIS